MKLSRYICILFLAAVSSVSANEITDDALARIAQLKSLGPAERTLIKSIQIVTDLPAGVLKVRATVHPTTNARVVEFSTRSMWKFEQLAVAMQLSRRIPNPNYLFGYIKYLAYAESFDNANMAALAFAKYYDTPNMPESIDGLSDAEKNEINWARQVMVDFILAHEFAHHLKDHLNPARVNSPIADESEADAWATAAVIEMGRVPNVAGLTLLLFNELENRSSSKQEELRSHPLSLKRAILLGKQSVNYMETNPELIANYARESNSPYEPAVVIKAIKDQVEGFRKMQALQNRLDDDPAFLTQMAQQVDLFSQIRLAQLYLTGDSEALGYNLKKSVAWMEYAAINNNNKYLYYESALASYAAGYMLTTRDDVPSNFERGCYHLGNSAKFTFLKAMFDLRYYRNLGKCAAP